MGLVRLVEQKCTLDIAKVFGTSLYNAVHWSDNNAVLHRGVEQESNALFIIQCNVCIMTRIEGSKGIEMQRALRCTRCRPLARINP